MGRRVFRRDRNGAVEMSKKIQSKGRITVLSISRKIESVWRGGRRRRGKQEVGQEEKQGYELPSE